VWFDDQTGWWNSSLLNYQTGVSYYALYVTELKKELCTRTWLLGAGAEDCVKPPLA